jgi:hypothetical protein
MQAIVTRYFGPSNVRGSRVKAAAQAGSVTLHWDGSQNSYWNHAAAAKALAEKYGWHYGVWHGGALPDGSMAWVCASDYTANDETFTLETKKVA